MAQDHDLVAARLHSGLTVVECCALTGRHRTTWCRMERGQSRVDLACLRLLELTAGELVHIHAGWSGWLLGRDGRLYAPGYRDGFEPGHVLSLPWLYQLISAYRAEIAAMHQTPLRQSPFRRILRKIAS